MSTTFTNSTSTGLLTGGIPTISQDLAPSIVFVVLYALTSALVVFRIFQYRGVCVWVFFRLLVFENVRLVTFILRIVAAENFSDALKGKASFNTGILIAEQVLLGVGFVMPTSTLIALVEAHSSRQTGLGPKKKAIFRAMELSLLAAIALGAVAGGMYSSSLTNASTRNDVKIERIVSAVVTLVALLLALGYCVYLLPKTGFPTSTTLWLGGTTSLLMIVPIYRIALIAHPPHDGQSTSAKAAFWVLQVTFEWLVGASLLSVNAIEWCGMGLEPLEKMTDAEANGLYAPRY
ncbi:hypothetical protein DENSPDRAFT_515110 [Dentipellis sp. KUC8613]|nr:hypothetical protein DENSPDRAFT_515110 [Dentipellis sp. KUC8613]